MSCIFHYACPQTGLTSTLDYDTETATWTLVESPGNTYTYTQTSTDTQFCNLMVLTSADGLHSRELHGVKVSHTDLVNCCKALGLPQVPFPGSVTSAITLTISGQTGSAVCLTAGPFTATSSGAPVLASWVIGDGTTGPCEGAITFSIIDRGGCVDVGLAATQTTVTLISASARTDSPYVLVYAINFGEDLGGVGTSGSATFTITIPNP
jgi:hypothetical protein